MFILFLILNIVILSAATEQESRGLFNVGAVARNNQGLSNGRDSFVKPEINKWTVILNDRKPHAGVAGGFFGDSSHRLELLYNSTYTDKEDNLLRVPNKYYDDNKPKKKIKKPPKRTVQKIIKKNKFNKSRKLYLFPATLLPTLPSKRFEDESNTRNIMPTTENISKKRPRKNPKYVRYPMPFQKLQRRDGSHTRYKRENRDLYIIKDFDEMKFLSNEKDYDKVVAHVQKHW